MNKYLLHGKLTAQDGYSQMLADILIKASKLMSNAKGFHLYAVALDEHDTNSVYIVEIWDSKEDHDNSLKLEGVRELIASAMPILDGLPLRGQDSKL